MTTFSEAFRSTRDLAISQGRKPVVCLVGPDMEAGFDEHCGEWAPYMKPMKKNDVWFPDFKPGDLGTLQGIRLRKMDHEGLAFITVPAPESGFDVYV